MSTIKASMQIATNVKIDYSQKDSLIYNLFKNIEDQHNGFYVDIGLTHPYFQSKTHQFFVRGWKGIELDYKYENLVKYFRLRPQTIPLNMALNNQNHYLDLYNISTTTLKDLCQRYYSKKPIFMTITIDQSHQTVQNLQNSLQSNNWSSQICRPQVLMIHFSQKNQILSKQIMYQKVLEKNNYEKYFSDNNSIIWIQSGKLQAYRTIQRQNQQLNSKHLKKINYKTLMTQINLKFNQFYQKAQNLNDLENYDPSNSSFYIHFSMPGVPIISQKVNLLSNQALLTKQISKYNRPILILQFNPLNTDFIVRQDNYFLSDFYLKYNQNLTLHFWELRIMKINQKKNERYYQIFILDHQYDHSQQKTEKRLNVLVKQNKASQFNQKIFFQKQLAFKVIFGILLLVLSIVLKLRKKNQTIKEPQRYDNA